MGSPSTETGHYRDEGQHQVSLTKGFFLGKYEVTQAQYLAVMTGNTDYKYVKPSRWPYNANRPVERVSWRTVQVFLKRLNHLQRLAGHLPEGWTYVLPTESQWEYACRAGTTSAYSWGDSIDKTNANYLWEGTYDFFADDKQPCEVGQYAPNPWGFIDTHGNVREWTADWLGAYPRGNPVINPTGATSSYHRVTRGGSWRFVDIGLRSAARHGTHPQADDSKIGFRVALQHQTHPEHEEAADEAPAGEAPVERAHEAPAGEVPVEEAHENPATPKKQKIDQAEAVILPFDEAKANPSKYWQSVNDHLMGGTSTGTSWFTNRDSLTFFGVLRLENGGGFASIRSTGQDLELRGATGILIRARGDGRSYWVDLHSPRYMNSFRAFLKTEKNGETETYIPLSEFKTQVDGFKAQSSGDTASLVEAQNPGINSLGFTIADKQAGKFRLEILSLKAVYRDKDSLDVPVPAVPGSHQVAETHEREVPAKGAHEAPAGEVPATTETPLYLDEMELLDADDLVPPDVVIPKKQKIHQVGPTDAKFQLIWVKPGTFIMGSPEDESGRKFNENQHQVTLTQGYYLGKYEVTQAQYKWVMGGLPEHYAKYKGTEFDVYNQGDDFPVGGANWNDAMAFCKKLTEMERKAGRLPKGMSFQLPTEAEWEYACRAGTTTIYSWGNHPERSKANFGHGFNAGKDFVDETNPVGQYQANPWGFHDMHGNVYEWCNVHRDLCRTHSPRTFRNALPETPRHRSSGASGAHRVLPIL